MYRTPHSTHWQPLMWMPRGTLGRYQHHLKFVHLIINWMDSLTHICLSTSLALSFKLNKQYKQISTKLEMKITYTSTKPLKNNTNHTLTGYTVYVLIIILLYVRTDLQQDQICPLSTCPPRNNKHCSLLDQTIHIHNYKITQRPIHFHKSPVSKKP